MAASFLVQGVNNFMKTPPQFRLAIEDRPPDEKRRLLMRYHLTQKLVEERIGLGSTRAKMW